MGCLSRIPNLDPVFLTQFLNIQFLPNVHYLFFDDLDPKPDTKQRKFRISMLQKGPLSIKVWICNLAKSSVADPNPESGAFLTTGSGIGFFRIPNLPYIFESLMTIFGVKDLDFL